MTYPEDVKVFPHRRYVCDKCGLDFWYSYNEDMYKDCPRCSHQIPPEKLWKTPTQHIYDSSKQTIKKESLE